jgi:hypothetical protein
MTLLRVEEIDSGGFTVLNLQMVARVKVRRLRRESARA